MTIATVAVHSRAVMSLVVERISKSPSVFSLFSILRVVMLNFWIGFASARLFNQISKFYLDQAIWFKGVAKDLWDANENPQDIEVLLLRIDRTKTRVSNMRQSLLNIKSSGKLLTRKASYEQALEGALCSMADYFEALEGLKWTLRELEANHAKRREGYNASSPEEVLALFSRIQEEA